jgi:hypothetical protein
VKKSDEPSAGGVELTPRDQADFAVQYQPENIDTQQSIVRRSHGRALPK